MADHANHMDATTLQGPNPGVVPPGHQDLTGRWEFHEYSNLFDDPFSPPPQAGVVVPPSRLTRYVHAAGGFAVWVSEFDIPTAPHPISLSEAIPMEVSTEEEPQPTDSQIMALLKVDTDCKRDAFQAWREQVRAERARAPLPEAECPICCESVHGRLFKQCPSCRGVVCHDCRKVTGDMTVSEAQGRIKLREKCPECRHEYTNRALMPRGIPPMPRRRAPVWRTDSVFVNQSALGAKPAYPRPLRSRPRSLFENGGHSEIDEALRRHRARFPEDYCMYDTINQSKTAGANASQLLAHSALGAPPGELPSVKEGIFTLSKNAACCIPKLVCGGIAAKARKAGGDILAPLRKSVQTGLYMEGSLMFYREYPNSTLYLATPVTGEISNETGKPIMKTSYEFWPVSKNESQLKGRPPPQPTDKLPPGMVGLMTNPVGDEEPQVVGVAWRESKHVLGTAGHNIDVCPGGLRMFKQFGGKSWPLTATTIRRPPHQESAQGSGRDLAYIEFLDEEEGNRAFAALEVRTAPPLTRESPVGRYFTVYGATNAGFFVSRGRILTQSAAQRACGVLAHNASTIFGFSGSPLMAEAGTGARYGTHLCAVVGDKRNLAAAPAAMSAFLNYGRKLTAEHFSPASLFEDASISEVVVSESDGVKKVFLDDYYPPETGNGGFSYDASEEEIYYNQRNLRDELAQDNPQYHDDYDSRYGYVEDARWRADHDRAMRYAEQDAEERDDRMHEDQYQGGRHRYDKYFKDDGRPERQRAYKGLSGSYAPSDFSLRPHGRNESAYQPWVYLHDLIRESSKATVESMLAARNEPDSEDENVADANPVAAAQTRASAAAAWPVPKAPPACLGPAPSSPPPLPPPPLERAEPMPVYTRGPPHGPGAYKGHRLHHHYRGSGGKGHGKDQPGKGQLHSMLMLPPGLPDPEPVTSESAWRPRSSYRRAVDYDFEEDWSAPLEQIPEVPEPRKPFRLGSSGKGGAALLNESCLAQETRDRYRHHADLAQHHSLKEKGLIKPQPTCNESAVAFNGPALVEEATKDPVVAETRTYLAGAALLPEGERFWHNHSGDAAPAELPPKPTTHTSTPSNKEVGQWISDVLLGGKEAAYAGLKAACTSPEYLLTLPCVSQYVNRIREHTGIQKLRKDQRETYYGKQGQAVFTHFGNYKAYGAKEKTGEDTGFNQAWKERLAQHGLAHLSDHVIPKSCKENIRNSLKAQAGRLGTCSPEMNSKARYAFDIACQDYADHLPPLFEGLTVESGEGIPRGWAKVVDNLQHKSAGWSARYRPLDKKAWALHKDPTIARELRVFVAIRKILRAAAGARMGVMDGDEMQRLFLSDPKEQFLKQESQGPPKSRENRWRIIWNSSLIDSICQQLMCFTANKNDIADFQTSGTTTLHGLGTGHDTQGVKHLISKVRAGAGEHAIHGSDASGFDLSVPRLGIMLDAERRSLKVNPVSQRVLAKDCGGLRSVTMPEPGQPRAQDGPDDMEEALPEPTQALVSKSLCATKEEDEPVPEPPLTEEDKLAIYRASALWLYTDAFANTAHTLNFFGEVWVCNQYGMTASGLPNTSSQNSFFRGFVLLRAGALWVITVGDDENHTGDVDEALMSEWGTITKKGSGTTGTADDFSMLSHRYVYEDGKCRAEYLNLDKMLATNLLMCSRGERIPEIAVAAQLRVLRSTPDQIAKYREIAAEFGGDLWNANVDTSMYETGDMEDEHYVEFAWQDAA